MDASIDPSQVSGASLPPPLRFEAPDAVAHEDGITLLFLRPLLPVHVFVGLLLVPPVALKLLSTGWRFLRYYRLLTPHKASFVVWGPTFGIHVLAYVWRIPRLALAAARLQRVALVGALALGVAGALAVVDVGHPALHWADFDDYSG